jgi:hypothetical protein
MTRNTLSQEELMKKFSYDPVTGLFTRLVNLGNFKAGSLVNIKPHKSGYTYIRITVDGKAKQFSLHRLAWLYVHGNLPEFVDHINHNRSDNRIENLRAVSRVENNKNQSIAKHNTSGHIGVSWHKGQKKWTAGIKVNYKRKHLGSYDNIDDAIRARKKAEALYGFHANHGR